MFKNLLVPLDGSPLAARVLPYAAELARRADGRVVLLQAHRKGQDPVDLTEQLALVQRAGARASIETVAESPAEAILNVAERENSDLILMSTHGRSGIGRWVYGSVAERVLHAAQIPVLLTSPGCTRDWSAGTDSHRVLVALDGSEFAEAALEPAKHLASALDAGIILTEIVDPLSREYAAASPYLLAFDPEEELKAADRYLEGIAARLGGEGYRVTIHTRLSFAPDAIAAIASNEHADAIVQATHGRGGLARLVLGSTAIGTLQRSALPVLLVRPAALNAVRQEVPASETAAAEVALSLTPAELAEVESALRQAANGEAGSALHSVLEKVAAARSSRGG